MDPIRFAIENPVKIAVGVILILMFGLLSLLVIAVQLTPNVDDPVISVSTRWEGASPQEIEQDVVREQEDKLKDVRGLEKMTSQSQQSQAQIILEFPIGTDMDRALIDVSNKLRQVPDYPENVNEPVVEASDPRNRDYIAWIILSTEDPDFDVRHLQKWAEDNVKTRLERVKGVSEVNVLGGSEPEIRVVVDARRMAQYGITPARLADVLRARNQNRSAGDLTEQKYELRLRTTGRYETIDEVEQTVVSKPGDPVVRILDFGHAELTYKEPGAIVRSKGEVALAINVQREVGSNVMAVMERLKAAIADMNQAEGVLETKTAELGLSAPLTLDQVFDQTVYIEQAFKLVRTNLFVGGSLAVLVLLLFLRSVRPTVIVALAIPVSIIGTFVALVGMGRNINVISLAGLAFAVGMVVDNAIVVLENIDRQLRLGKPRGRASYDGAKEVWGAILTSTLTTLAVFVPVLTVQEEAGQLFRDIALAICAAVTLSLLVSVMVIPTAAARFIARHDHGQDAQDPAPEKGTATEQKRRSRRNPFHAVGAAIDRAAGAFASGFRNLVYWITGTWVVRPVLILGMAGLAVLASYLLMPPATYLPTGNRNLTFGILVPPPGYSLEKMEEIGQRVERVVEPYWEAHGDPEATDNLSPINWQGQPVGVPPISNFFFVGIETGIMFTGAISADPDVVDPVGLLLNSAIQDQPAILGGARKRALIGSGAGGSAIEMELTGDDLGRIVAAGEALFPQLGMRFGFQNVRPDPGNFNLPAEEVQVRIDDVRASDLDLNNADLATAIQFLGDGAIVDEYIYQGDGIDLRIQHNNPNYESALAVGDIQITTPEGWPVPVRSVADVVRTVAPQQINRIERQRSITFTINVPTEVPVDVAVRQIETEMIAPLRASGVISPTVDVNLEGTAAKLATVKRAMLGEWRGFNTESLLILFQSRAFLALVVVFLVMAALFESWLYPLVILFTVPLATVGGFLGLRAVHEWTAAMPFVETQQLDVLTMLGFIILIGIVVNNAILIVHQALNFMRGEADVEDMSGQKLEPRRAIAESVRTRIRPILMSTFTSIGGMLPLVLFPGAGSELYRGLGSVVVGGLLVAAVFTLLLTPMVMSVVFDLRKLVARGEEIKV